MAIDQDILNPNTNWEDQTKGYVEDGLKELLRAILAALDEPAAEGSVGLAALTQQLRDLVNNAVPNTRKVNNKPLSENVTLGASDVGAMPANAVVVKRITVNGDEAENNNGTVALVIEGGGTADLSHVFGKVEYNSTTKRINFYSPDAVIGTDAPIGYIDAAPFVADGPGGSVVINSDGANIVDSHNNPSILVAPSARQMYMAYQNINTLFNKVNDLYDKLAGIAFKDGKPANWKENANWLTPAIPTHTITLDTSSNVSASMNGTTISGSTSASEGKVTILLTPSGNNYMGNISVKDASNNDVAFTQTDVTGGTEITFILSGNVTISASASSGIQVNVSGTGITSYTTGVQPNTAAQLTIALPEHHTWDSVTVSYGGTDITSQCTISQANNADKVITLPNNLSDMSKSISIVANTVEDAHVMLAVSGSGYTISDGTKTYSNGDKVYNTVQVTLSIAPASGKKFTTLPTADKGTMTNNGAYAASSLDIGTSVSGTVTISAETADLTNYSVGIQSISNFSVAYTDLSGNAIAAVNNVATVVENSGVKIRLTPNTDYSLTNISMTMGGSPVTPSVTTDNGVTVITIEHVTGAVVVSATAVLAGQVSVTKTIGRGEGTITGNDSVTAGSTYSCAIAPAADWGLKAANVKVLIDGVEAAASDYTLTIDSSYNGSLSIPTTANLQSLEVVVEFAVLLYSGKYIANSGAFLDKVGTSNYTPCSTKAYIPLPDTFTPAAGDTFNWCYKFPAYTIFSSNSEPVYLVFYNNSLAKTTNWSAKDDNVRSATFPASVVGSKNWRTSFNVDKIEECYLKYTPSGKSEITLFDGSDTDSYIIVKHERLE